MKRQHTLRPFTNLILTLLALVFSPVATSAQKAELQAEMYRLFTQPDMELFMTVTDSLKHVCEREGDEQSFYKAWGNQAIYLSRNQHRREAMATAEEMKSYAVEHGSKFGEYTSLHCMASLLYQMQNLKKAEEMFLQSIDYLHKNFPGESAAPAYLELTNLANKLGDHNTAYYYAKNALGEPNLAPQHELRALSMLCQIDALWGDQAELNRNYEKRRQVRQHTQADGLEAEVNVLWNLHNGHLEEALKEAADLPARRRYFMLASISHTMGNDADAYLYMRADKRVNDSLSAVSQSDIISEYIVELSQEQLENERMQLRHEADSLRTRYRLAAVAAVLALLCYIIWRRYRTIRQLRRNNEQLDQARRAEHEARQEAEKALDVKREFINNISHELRTPLNPITGFSDILATPGFELAAEEREAMSRHIKDSSHTLTGIIDHMIELSFYESKTSLPQEDVVYPNMVCQSLIDEMQAHCQQGVELLFTTDVLEMTNVKTDLQSVQKVLRQLIDNSQKHTSEGSIVVHVGEVPAAAGQACGSIRFTVTDTGSGVPDFVKPHLFEPFSQTDDNVQVTGMGLAICERIAKLLDGRVYYDDGYTKGGSRFVFEIPLRK